MSHSFIRISTKIVSRIKEKTLADEDAPYSHCQLRNLKEYKLIIVRTMLYLRIGIVSSKRRKQKVNLELSSARAHLPRILLRRIVFRTVEATALCKWLVTKRMWPCSLLPAFLCAQVFIEKEASGYEAVCAQWKICPFTHKRTNSVWTKTAN